MVDSKIAIPTWLSKDFLTKVLKEDDLSKQLNVISYSVNPAVVAGNNFLSTTLRVKIEYETKGEKVNTSIIMKTSLQDGITKNTVEELGIHSKETMVYKELLPLINNMAKINIAPKAYFSSGYEAIILEDLKEQGYTMCDKLEQLDFDHCNKVMKTIGIFHAASLHIFNEKPELIENVGKDVFLNDDAKAESKLYFLGAIDSFVSVLEEWEGFEHFSKFFKNNVHAVFDKIAKISFETKHLKVLNHGDLWTNNILYKHDDKGSIIDLKLIDMQLCKFSSPALDIISFIITSVQEDVKRQRLSELFYSYIESFNSTLEDIGSGVRLSLEQFYDELKFAEIFSIYVLLFDAPMMLCEKDYVFDMDKLMESWANPNKDGKGLFHKLLNFDQYKIVAKYTLKKLEDEGFLLSL